MHTQIKIPDLTVGIITHVVTDAVDLCPGVEAVGLVGSFARGEQKQCSDVDLIVKPSNAGKFQDILEGFGMHVRHILDYQFNKRLDIIRYELVLERASRPPSPTEPWFCQETFAKMLKEVKWLYER